MLRQTIIETWASQIIDVAKSFGLEVLSLTNDDKINSVVDEIIFSEKPIFCDIKVSLTSESLPR